MKFRLLVFVVLAAALAANGCKSSSSAPPTVCPDCANREVLQAEGALSSGNYALADSYYRQAVAHDAGNKKAQAGVAVTGLFLVGSDAEVARVLGSIGLPVAPLMAGRGAAAALLRSAVRARPGASSMRQQALRAFARAGQDPALFSDVQNVIKTHVLPQLQEIENRLQILEGIADFSYIVTVRVGTQTQSIEIDRGDIYVLDALVNLVQGSLGPLVAYNLDVPPSGSTDESLLAPGSSFGLLRADGTAQLASAYGSLLLVKTRFDQAVASIRAETDDQSDDIIPIAVLDTPEFASLELGVADFDGTLRGSITVSATDALGAPFPLLLHAGGVYVPPIVDLKTKLPAHTFDLQHQLVISSPLTFPDPAINGIFPDMTNERWRSLLGTPVMPAAIARR